MEVSRRSIEISKRKEFKFMSIIRYIFAVPLAFILFYIVGQVLLFTANWSYITELNKFLVLPIIFVKNIVLAVSLYKIMPKFKKGAISIVGIVMILLSAITIYIYLTNGAVSLASIYTMQIIMWIGILVFIYRKFSDK